MSTVTAREAVFEELRSLAFGSISSSYAIIGTVFANPVRIVYVQNLTDVTLIFSNDGVTDHVCLPAQGFILLDLTANKTVDSGFYFDRFTGFYVKDTGSAASTGSVYLTAIYGKD